MNQHPSLVFSLDYILETNTFKEMAASCFLMQRVRRARPQETWEIKFENVPYNQKEIVFVNIKLGGLCVLSVVFFATEFDNDMIPIIRELKGSTIQLNDSESQKLIDHIKLAHL